MLHARTQTSRLDGQCDCDVIGAEFALRRCHLSSTERIFSFALFAKNVAIDLKCVENHGGKPWLTPQLAASCKWSSFRDCQGIFPLLRERTLGAWRWIFKL